MISTGNAIDVAPIFVHYSSAAAVKQPYQNVGLPLNAVTTTDYKCLDENCQYPQYHHFGALRAYAALVA
jgi:hypothetical protein